MSTAKCGSDHIIPAARLVDRGHYSGDAGGLLARVDATPFDALRAFAASRQQA